MKRKWFSLSPLLLFLVLYLATSLIAGDFYKVPISVAFLVSAVYAIAISPGSLADRIETFSKGAGSTQMMLMLWIFILAGAFAGSARAMGAVDATVSLTLSALPASLLLPSVFLASCFISLAIGTSCGTIAALTPVAVGIAQQTGTDLPLMCAIVVGGAFFGDNLSFISDTTIIATQTQGCRMSDKFRTNFRLVLPVAIAVVILYYFIGRDLTAPQDIPTVEWWKVLPYVTVIVLAVLGMNVTVVLLIGVALTGIVGVWDSSYDLWGWAASLSSGMMGMSELIIVTLLAAGMLAMIKSNGGIDYIIYLLTRRISSARGAELSVAGLVALIDICTANNTVTLITAGPIAHNISRKFNIDPRRMASILDTASCSIQGLLPYGAQVLIAAGLAGEAIGLTVSPSDIIRHLYYPMGLGVIVILSILLRKK